MAKVKTNRGLLKYILLTLVTCGIYELFFINGIANDMNTMCKDDGLKTKGILGFIVLTCVTCGIYPMVWFYGVANRLSENGNKYGLNISENGTNFLLWMIFGALLCGIGPFVAMHALCKNLNRVGEAYNKTLETPAAPAASAEA
ncbi:MAG: DUF4234 domain-containing protein [Clostridia bacterium]|nr:DUF4234 domain-containing protein [Clostridia bacterium]